MGPSASACEHTSLLKAGPNSGHSQPATATDAHDATHVAAHREPAAAVCHTSPYITHTNHARATPGHYSFQQSAGGDLGVVLHNYSLIRRSSSCASSLKSLPPHVHHELLLQQGPKVCVPPGIQVHHADAAAATAAPTSPRTPGGSPRDSPSTANLSPASAAAMHHCSSPRFKQQQQQGSAPAQPQSSNLMALADAAVACQQQQSGELAGVAAVGGDRVMASGDRVSPSNCYPDSRFLGNPLAPAVAAAAAAAAHVSTRPTALQCVGFSDVYTSCDYPSAAATSELAAAAYPGAPPQEALAQSTLATISAAAAAAPSCLTKADLQNRLSQELEQSPLLTVLLGRLVRRLRQQQQRRADSAAKQTCGSIQQQQQGAVSANVEYAAIMPGVLQRQDGSRVRSTSGSSNSSSTGGSCDYRAVRLTKQSFVELPAGCLLVGPGTTVANTAAPTAPTAAVAASAGASKSLLQQQQQCMPGSLAVPAHSPTATGASPKSFKQQQQQCDVWRQALASKTSPAAAAAVTSAVQQRQRQQPSSAPFTSTNSGRCSTLYKQQQLQQPAHSTIQHRPAVHITSQQQMQMVDYKFCLDPNAAAAKSAGTTTQPVDPSGGLATNPAAAAPALAATASSSRQSCVGSVHKRSRELWAGGPAVMAADAGTVPAATAWTGATAETTARPKLSSQQQHHPLTPAEAHISINGVCPCHEPNMHLPYKRQCTISASGSAAAAAHGSRSNAVGQKWQQLAAGPAATARQQQELSERVWPMAPSPLTSSYPK